MSTPDQGLPREVRRPGGLRREPGEPGGPPRDGRDLPGQQGATTARRCGRCGQPSGLGDHGGCVRALALEPPRYCPDCGRRLVVQVLPTGWTARCSAHGELA